MGTSSEARADATTTGIGRSLKTAAEALAALRLLGANPDGVTAERLAVALGKSASTARYLLNTLCQEGYATKEGAAGVHRLVETPPWGGAWGPVRDTTRHELPERLMDAVSTPARRFAQESAATERAVAEVATTATRERRAQAEAPPRPP